MCAISLECSRVKEDGACDYRVWLVSTFVMASFRGEGFLGSVVS